MAITPLYTAAELDAEITQAKQDLAAARRALSWQVDNDTGGGRRQQHEQVLSLQRHLEWLQKQRVAQEIGSGYQSLTGVPAR